MNPDQIYGGFAAVRNYVFPSHSTADSWVLTANLIPSTGDAVEIAASAIEGTGTAWELTIPASALVGMTAGTVTLQLIATLDGVSSIALVERITLFAADATDLRSLNRTTLDALDATLAGKATRDQTSLAYNGRSISRMSWDDLLSARAALTALVADEDRRATGASKIQTVKYRFTNA